eukprot:scaffold199037_cov17-Tisochrysis_lutea.AAC.1
MAQLSCTLGGQAESLFAGGCLPSMHISSLMSATEQQQLQQAPCQVSYTCTAAAAATAAVRRLITETEQTLAMQSQVQVRCLVERCTLAWNGHSIAVQHFDVHLSSSFWWVFWWHGALWRGMALDFFVKEEGTKAVVACLPSGCISVAFRSASFPSHQLTSPQRLSLIRLNMVPHGKGCALLT